MTPRVLINCLVSQIRACCLSFQSGKLATDSRGTPRVHGISVLCLVLSCVLNGCSAPRQLQSQQARL